MVIRQVRPEEYDEWLRMRLELWPEHTPEEHRSEMDGFLANPDRERVFVFHRPDGSLGGFLEASMRKYADGCDTRPVGYIEGWYVDPDLRCHGVGGELVRAAEAWALAKGCQEMASDCEIDNTVSLAAHLALGYTETERLIHFCKRIR
jgi:aminoglycoside 6'-N-acetyltransferase I